MVKYYKTKVQSVFNFSTFEVFEVDTRPEHYKVTLHWIEDGYLCSHVGNVIWEPLYRKVIENNCEEMTKEEFNRYIPEEAVSQIGALIRSNQRRSCRTCAFFSPGVRRSDLLVPDDVIGECNNPEVPTKLCVKYGMICNGDHFKMR